MWAARHAGTHYEWLVLSEVEGWATRPGNILENYESGKS
jgi:hypothetical protein